MIAYCFTQCPIGCSLGRLLFPLQDNCVQMCMQNREGGVTGVHSICLWSKMKKKSLESHFSKFDKEEKFRIFSNEKCRSKFDKEQSFEFLNERCHFKIVILALIDAVCQMRIGFVKPVSFKKIHRSWYSKNSHFKIRPVFFFQIDFYDFWQSSGGGH